VHQRHQKPLACPPRDPSESTASLLAKERLAQGVGGHTGEQLGDLRGGQGQTTGALRIVDNG
jgi:hypothetical protein